MALKGTWIDLEDYVEGVPDSGQMASAEDINEIAHAVIELEEKGGSGGSVDLSNYYTKKEINDFFVSKANYIVEQEGIRSDINKITTSLNTKANKSTTLAGYGIKDAYTKTEVDNLIGEIDSALDELHNYAQALIGGASE